ncbi:MAG: hypothetical protein SVR94_06810, partial [Pseudomonadota bacterium]|nr:hypothetical protein [Pseudomonadota bacterium]
PVNHNPPLLFKSLLTQLNMPVPESCDLVNFIDTVSMHLNDIPTFILLDDIEVGLHSQHLDQAFWGGFRYLGFDATRGKLAFLLTAPEVPVPPLGEPSTFIGMFGRVLELGPLTEAEALTLLNTNAQIMSQILGDGFEVLTAHDKQWILEQTQGWPALLQIVCNVRFEALQAQSKVADWRLLAQEQLVASRCWHYLIAE